MEFAKKRRGRKRRRVKCSHKRLQSAKSQHQLSDIIKKKESKSSKVRPGQHKKGGVSECKGNCSSDRRGQEDEGGTMEASAFWENYKAGHEWQKKHDVTWWKTRCYALEHENYVLKGVIQNMIENQHRSYNANPQVETTSRDTEDHPEVKVENTNGEDLEFHMSEDMINFLAQSMRHKLELRNKRRSSGRKVADKAATTTTSEDLPQSRLAMAQKRNDEAKLLYGEASSKVLAMETALQATIERHLDRTKAQYWPNIPLRL